MGDGPLGLGIHGELVPRASALGYRVPPLRGYAVANARGVTITTLINGLARPMADNQSNGDDIPVFAALHRPWSLKLRISQDASKNNP